MVYLKPKRCLRQHWFQVDFAYVSQHHNADNSRPYMLHNVAGINILGKFMLLYYYFLEIRLQMTRCTMWAPPNTAR